VDIRGYLFYVKQEMIEDAVQHLREYLPFPAITGRLCYHPCEAGCARKDVDEAVNIRGLERYVAEVGLKEKPVAPPLIHAARAAVVGAGPAGLSAAYFLRRMGYGVTVFEATSEAGGTLKREVREGRLPESILRSQIKCMNDLGIEIKRKWPLGTRMSLQELREERFRAVLLATGFNHEAIAPLPEGLVSKDKVGIAVDPVTLATRETGVFASGGVIAERKPLVQVIALARRAALSMDIFLQNKSMDETLDPVISKVTNLPGKGIKPLERQPVPGDKKGRGKGGSREDTLGDVTALLEAQRCMSCGGKAYIAHPEDCMTCFECEVECPSGAVSVHPFKEPLPMTISI
jgi:NADPH-dependent glutamate synthase beta subunit-like oxidoreductase/NAD-dependent dihydropyrimidine dehydrogenase PreA subunit